MRHRVQSGCREVEMSCAPTRRPESPNGSASDAHFDQEMGRATRVHRRRQLNTVTRPPDDRTRGNVDS